MQNEGGGGDDTSLAFSSIVPRLSFAHTTSKITNAETQQMRLDTADDYGIW